MKSSKETIQTHGDSHIRLLMIEDEQSDLQKVVDTLKQTQNIDVTIECVASLAEGIERAQAGDMDLVMLDLALPDSSGVDTLIRARIHIPSSIPIIVFTGVDDDQLAVRIAREGAEDLIKKSDLDPERLAFAIHRATTRYNKFPKVDNELKKQEYSALCHPLTDLPNQQLLYDRLAQSIKVAKRHAQQLAILYVDIDGYLSLVKKHDEATGRQLIYDIARRLISTIRENDTVAHVDADDFVVILSNIVHARDGARVAQKILDALSEEPYIINGIKINITASIGISIYPADGNNPEQLIIKSDAALFRAREQAGNSYQFSTPAMNASAFERLVLEERLNKAIDKKEFRLQYQPQLDLPSGEIIGMEALIRWKHPYLGLVYPIEFIQLAEETRMIVPIGEWVLKEACRQNQYWIKKGYGPYRVKVNISAQQFRNQKVVESIDKALEESQMDPEYIGVEITESVAMENIDRTVRVLNQIRERGIEISIDDFGIGYSSLNYLKRLPIDVIKIHQTFVSDLATSGVEEAIVSAVIHLAHKLNLKVIAEGVETEEQFIALRELKCDSMQGYYFSRPVGADKFEEYLKTNKHL